jgi:hypothetical protein
MTSQSATYKGSFEHPLKKLEDALHYHYQEFIPGLFLRPAGFPFHNCPGNNDNTQNNAD